MLSQQGQPSRRRVGLFGSTRRRVGVDLAHATGTDDAVRLRALVKEVRGRLRLYVRAQSLPMRMLYHFMLGDSLSVRAHLCVARVDVAKETAHRDFAAETAVVVDDVRGSLQNTSVIFMLMLTTFVALLAITPQPPIDAQAEALQDAAATLADDVAGAQRLRVGTPVFSWWRGLGKGGGTTLQRFAALAVFAPRSPSD